MTPNNGVFHNPVRNLKIYRRLFTLSLARGVTPILAT